MTVFTIDVSHYDWDRNGGALDWPAIRDSGIAGMCARATYGDPSVYAPETRHFGSHVAGAKMAGFPLLGGYHNLIHGDAASIARQVAWFRSELSRVGANWAMLDVEPYDALQGNGLWPRWEDVVHFGQRWRALSQQPLVFYIARWVWDTWLGRPDLSVLGAPIIGARYSLGTRRDTARALYESAGGDSGAGWAPYGMVVPRGWQFTASATVDGASAVTDVNAFRGSLADLYADLTGEAMALPANWRVVEAIRQFHRQCRPLAPNQPPEAFGTVADAAHSSTSDHYPHYVSSLGSRPVVTAGDIPLAERLDPRAVLDSIRRSHDPRVKYGISRGEMFSSYPTSQYPAWTWRPYSGKDGHFDHGHLSTVDGPAADDARPWQIGDDDMTPEQHELLRRTERHCAWLATRLYAFVNGDKAIDWTAPGAEDAKSQVVTPNVLLQSLVDAASAGGMSDEQAKRQAEMIAEQLVARPDNPLTDADLPVIVKGVQEALRAGTGV